MSRRRRFFIYAGLELALLSGGALAAHLTSSPVGNNSRVRDDLAERAARQTTLREGPLDRDAISVASVTGAGSRAASTPLRER
jgi:hypothetical protein